MYYQMYTLLVQQYVVDWHGGLPAAGNNHSVRGSHLPMYNSLHAHSYMYVAREWVNARARVLQWENVLVESNERSPPR